MEPKDAGVLWEKARAMAKCIEGAVSGIRVDAVSINEVDESYTIRVVDLERKPAGIVSQSKGW